MSCDGGKHCFYLKPHRIRQEISFRYIMAGYRSQRYPLIGEGTKHIFKIGAIQIG